MSFLRRKRSQSASSQQDRPPAPSPPSPPRSLNHAGSSTTRALGVPLAPVHEANRAPSPRRPPPSAFKAVPTPQVMRGAVGNGIGPKGKERDDLGPAMQRAGRAAWVCDSEESRRGASIWQQSDRVILVLGEVTRAVLAPLLHSPSFADTLILVGSISPIPEIEALNSPSQLLNASDGRTIYPTIQPFVVPASALATTTPQAAILSHGTTLAQAYRAGGNATTPGGLPRPPMSSRSRRGSTTSLRSINGSATPPGTPPVSTPPTSRRRIMSFSRRSSDSPMGSPRGSASDLSALGQQQQQQSTRPSSAADQNSEDRPKLRSRLSAYLRNENFSREGSPFDAVINFIPSPPLDIDPQRALQEMLQYTVVLTSAAMPILMSAVTDNSISGSLAIRELAPLSLVHIVPVDAPPALAPVIERFLLPLLPTMGKRVRRDLFGVVTGLGAWLAPQADPINCGLPGADTILFGGVRCPVKNVTDEDRQQAMLAGWNHCQCIPGMLVDIEREEPPPVFSKRASALELSNIRPRGAGHSREHSFSSVASVASISPPMSPNTNASSPEDVLPPPGAAPRNSPPLQPLPHARKPSLPRNTLPAGFSASPRISPPSTRSSLPPRADLSAISTNPSFRQQNPAFTSRFDPANKTREYTTASNTTSSNSNSNTLRPSAPDLSTITTKSSHLPPGAAGPGEMGELDMTFGMSANGTKKRSPSGLRNTVTLPSLASPPTPELDTSGSSCSSSSVIEPSWNTEKSSKQPPHGLMRSMSSRKGFGFTSLFRRNGLKA